MRGSLIAQTICILLLAGCSSISSTMLNRLDNDMFVGNSNGEPNMYCQATPFKGVPITVRVPTHLDVAIKEKIDIYIKDEDLKVVRGLRRNLFVEASTVLTEKVFTVDVSRPIAGNIDYTFDFNSDGKSTNPQYFRQVKAKIVDETIQDVNAALGTLMPLFGNKSGRSTSATNADIVPEIRTVAWKRFDIDSPSFELDVQTFVEQHLNCCRDCQSADIRTDQGRTTQIPDDPS
jgi:hypothetical protein